MSTVLVTPLKATTIIVRSSAQPTRTLNVSARGRTVAISVNREIRTGVAQQRYTHTQTAPAATWTVNHNLGRKPHVQVVSVGGVVVEAACAHISDNQTVITFNTAQAGQAFFD